jgi:hypothetical protein
MNLDGNRVKRLHFIIACEQIRRLREGGHMIRGIGGDVRLALRSLRATPAVSVAAIVTLGLSIGATTALFSVANGVILRPLPVKDPERLATITSDTALRYGFRAGGGWSYGMWDQLRQRDQPFDGAFAWALQPLDLPRKGSAASTSVSRSISRCLSAPRRSFAAGARCSTTSAHSC